MCGINSTVECNLPKVEVAGSNPVSRFRNTNWEKGVEESEVRDCELAQQSQRVADPERSGNEGRQIPYPALFNKTYRK